MRTGELTGSRSRKELKLYLRITRRLAAPGRFTRALVILATILETFGLDK